MKVLFILLLGAIIAPIVIASIWACISLIRGIFEELDL